MYLTNPTKLIDLINLSNLKSFSYPDVLAYAIVLTLPILLIFLLLYITLTAIYTYVTTTTTTFNSTPFLNLPNPATDNLALPQLSPPSSPMLQRNSPTQSNFHTKTGRATGLQRRVPSPKQQRSAGNEDTKCSIRCPSCGKLCPSCVLKQRLFLVGGIGGEEECDKGLGKRGDDQEDEGDDMIYEMEAGYEENLRVEDYGHGGGEGDWSRIEMALVLMLLLGVFGACLFVGWAEMWQVGGERDEGRGVA